MKLRYVEVEPCGASHISRALLTLGDAEESAREKDPAAEYDPSPAAVINTRRIAAEELSGLNKYELLGVDKHGVGVDNIDLGDPAALQSTLTAAGFDWHELAERVADPAVKNALREATEDAVAQGIFGAPSFIVDGELFFGQDRLDFVERALTDS